MKILSVSEARKQFSSAVNWAEQNKDDVIIKSRGESKVVIIPFSDYELLQDARELERKRKAVEEFKALANEVRQSFDMTDEQAEKMADEISRESIDSLVAKGEVVFTK